MWYDSYIHYVTTLALYTSAFVYTLVKMVMIWPTSGTNWPNAQIDTPRALFQHKGLPWDCPLLCFNIFQESISWDLSQHSGICGSEDLKGFQETSSQLTQNKSAEIFPNITLQKQLYKTFLYIFSLNMCKIWNLGPFSKSSQVIKYIPSSLPPIRQSQSCGG